MKPNNHWLRGIAPMILTVAKAIDTNQLTINALNEFPVPDGDTGTNLAKTLGKIAKDVSDLVAGLPAGEEVDPQALLNTIAKSAKKGAQGNSGIILSAMIDGAMEELRTADELSVNLVARSLTAADKKARTAKGLDKVVEGTMMTVIRAMAVAATEADKRGETSITEVAKEVLTAAVRTANKTPEMMEKLKGKIDSGAFALALMALSVCNQAIDEVLQWPDLSLEDPSMNAASIDNNLNWQSGTPLYCTEFLWYRGHSRKPTEQEAKKFLAKIGDSEMYLADDELARVHVHTNEPYKVLAFFAKHGEVAEFEVHNMRLQTEEHQRELARAAAEASSKPPKPIGVVAVANGKGMKALMTEMGADVIVDGGQTSNPNAGTIAEAIESVNADAVIVLPSNKNIAATAELACTLTDKDCTVIRTLNMPETLHILTTLHGHESDADFATVSQALEDAYGYRPNVAAVTVAIKDYVSGCGLEVKSGDVIAIADDEVMMVCSSQNEAVIGIIEYLIRDIPQNDVETVTVYTGMDFKDSIEALQAGLEKLPLDSITEKSVIDGGQPVFSAMVEVQRAL
ncbi:DAK2 domain-containing protein [Candidatus Saccharibacteria bacterium]|nr:DAK2 domain-containing protein [Candidatus Saccharibacteria bacterium]